MREIRFRKWDSNTKTMDNDPKVSIEQDLDITAVYLGAFFEGNYGVEYMQYTGLKDKNGVLIYEGDIVQFPNASTSKLTISFGDRGSFEGNGFNGRHQLYTLDMKVYEVIGNIYENPELLKY